MVIESKTCPIHPNGVIKRIGARRFNTRDKDQVGERETDRDEKN